MESTPMTATPRLRAAVLLSVLLGILLPLGGCSTIGGWFGSDDTAARIDPAKVPPEQLYNNGLDAMNGRHYESAIKQFDAVQENYPYAAVSVNAQLMQGFAEYRRQHYLDAIGVLDRFIQLHPTHHEIAYAYYLRALCFYEQIADIRRDQHTTREAMKALQEVANRFPDSAYARDARLKIDLCNDHLAGKEMDIGRWYERQHLYAAAINRFQDVVDTYQTTNHAAEALHRLTEIYLILGMKDQARRTASVLGYNYPGSEWYEDSYNQLLDDNVLRQTAGNTPPPTGASAPPSGGSTTAPPPGEPPPPPARSFFDRTLGSIF
jgi:outer membrane protein assembly factor BamD